MQNHVNHDFVLFSEFQENFVLLWSIMAANNMYRVGDYVYVDQGPTVPFGVRRIDELQKSASGNVEMEVMIYLRRLDLSKDVLPMADENLKGNLLVLNVLRLTVFLQNFGMRCQRSTQPRCMRGNSSWLNKQRQSVLHKSEV